MRWRSLVVAHALAASAIGGLAACTPLRPLEPGGDGGARADARRYDASGLDAPGIDAPGLDATSPWDAGSSDAFAGLDASTMDADCSGAPRCVGSTLRTCERGRAIDSSCALGCLSGDGGAHCGVMVPSNIAGTFLAGAASDYAAAETSAFDTTACSGAPVMGLTFDVATQSDGREVCVVAMRNFTVPAGVALRVTGSRPLVIAASGDVVIDGILDVSAMGEVPGAGGGAGGAFGRPGEGPAPGSAGMRAASSTTDDGGGGGGAGCGSGGDGGDAPPSTGGRGGIAPPSTTLSPLVGGSGGGAGSGLTYVGEGGGGGGAVQITALGSITIRGSVRAGGGAGQRSVDGTGGAPGGGGGGGSGGSVLLEAPSIALEMGAEILATGGGGGAGAGPGFSETPAEDGAALARRARGGTGGGIGGANGGESGAGDTPAGLAGQDQASSGNGGGGGGGAGCIVLRAASAPSTTAASLSPSARGLAILPLTIR